MSTRGPAGPARARLSPTTAGWWGAGVCLAVLGILLRRPDVAVLGLPFLLGAGWATWSAPPRVSPVAIVPGEQRPGQLGVSGELRLDPPPGADSGSGSRGGLVAVRIGAPGHRPAEALLLAGERRLAVRVAALRTGRRELFGLDVRDSSADGLQSTDARSRPPVAVTVLPLSRPLHLAPLPLRLQGLAGPHPSRRAGDGGDLRDVGPFVTGDRLRRIDWRVTARRNTGTGLGGTVTQLYTRRTFATAEATVMLVVDSRDEIGPRLVTWGDTSRLREDEATSLDIARTAAASLARHYLSAGDRVGLEDLGRFRRPLAPAGGRRQQLRIVQRLARTEPEGEPVPGRRTPRLPSGALILMLSTFLDDDATRMATTWHTSGHRVVAVDTLPPVLLAGANPRLTTAYRLIAMERADRIETMCSLGVEWVVWRSDGPVADLDRIARRRVRP